MTSEEAMIFNVHSRRSYHCPLACRVLQSSFIEPYKLLIEREIVLRLL